MKFHRTAVTVMFLTTGVPVAHAQASLPESAESMRALVLQRAPLGTEINRAKASVEDLGLSCSWVQNQPFSGLPMASSYYYCSRLAGSPVAKRWQLALLTRDGRLQDVYATYGLVGP